MQKFALVREVIQLIKKSNGVELKLPIFIIIFEEEQILKDVFDIKYIDGYAVKWRANS